MDMLQNKPAIVISSEDENQYDIQVHVVLLNIRPQLLDS